MSDKKTRMPAGWNRVAWVPRYDRGPHLWAITWTGRAHVWLCLNCGGTPAQHADTATDCPGWHNRTVSL